MIEDFEEYIRQGEPSQKEKSQIWQTAIGLQQVDGLTTSGYLGGVSLLQKLIISFMQQNPKVSVVEIARQTDKPRRTVENNVKKLKESGIIAREGADKNGKWVVLILLCILFPFQLFSQEEKPVNLSYRSTLIGGGLYNIYDTYLTPGNESKYNGWGIRVLSDHMKMTDLWDGNISTQQLIDIDFSSTRNKTETASDYSLFIDYSYGLHYHFRPLPKLRLLAGSNINPFLGAIYNTRNGNNPVSAKVNVNLSLSGMADYRFQIKNQPFTIRYQMDVPFIGCMFSPQQGESYYEISLGNHDNLVHFASFHNQFIMKNYFTIEMPLQPITLRLTYLNNLYNTNVGGIKTSIHSNTFLIGFVKEFFSIPGRKQINGNKYRRVFD